MEHVFTITNPFRFLTTEKILFSYIPWIFHLDSLKQKNKKISNKKKTDLIFIYVHRSQIHNWECFQIGLTKVQIDREPKKKIKKKNTKQQKQTEKKNGQIFMENSMFLFNWIWFIFIFIKCWNECRRRWKLFSNVWYKRAN